MGEKNRHRFTNVYFNRFFENTLHYMPQAFLRFFTPSERKKLIRYRGKVIQTSVMEEKLYYMAKCGIRFALVMVDPSKKSWGAREMARLFRIFKKKTGYDKLGLINELKDAGVFCLSDSDFVRSCNIVAGIMQEKDTFTYLQSYGEINDAFYKYHLMHKKMDKEEAAMSDINKLLVSIVGLSNTTAGSRFLSDNYGINANMLSIMLTLSRLGMVESSLLKHSCPVFSFDKNISELLSLKMIDEHKRSVGDNEEVKDYRISGYGEIVMSEVRKHILEQIYK